MNKVIFQRHQKKKKEKKQAHYKTQAEQYAENICPSKVQSKLDARVMKWNGYHKCHAPCH